VFHISQLKKRIGQGTITSTSLPIVGSDGRLRIAPAEILGRRMIKKGNAAEVELLIRWTNLPESEATWEEYQRLKLQFPYFVLGDKEIVMGREMSGTSNTIRCRIEKEDERRETYSRCKSSNQKD
jgi:hypothetical protein